MRENDSLAFPWDLRGKVLDFLKPASQVLEVFPKSPDFLLSLGHPKELLSAMIKEGESAEGFLSCGISRFSCAEGTFDLVVSQDSGTGLSELKNLLKPGGVLFYEDRGGKDGLSLRRKVFPGEEIPEPPNNLENMRAEADELYLRVLYRNQAIRQREVNPSVLLAENFLDSYLSKISHEKLLQVLKGENFPYTCHRFIIIAQKRREN